MKNFIKNFDFLYQNSDYTCGSTCAAMVVGAFGIRNNKRLLRKLLLTDFNEGTFQRDLSNGIRLFGPLVAGRKFSVATKSFIDEVKFPPDQIYCTFESYFSKGYLAIACVDDGQHYIVVRGIRNSRVYIADPEMFSPKYMTLTKFAKRIKKGSAVFIKKEDK